MKLASAPLPLPDLDPHELLRLLPHMNDEERDELDKILTAGLPHWLEQVGPQTQALESLADIVFYGGQAGGGKTDLLIGASTTRHQKSIIFRREGVQLVGIVERMAAALRSLGGRELFNGSDAVWRVPSGGVERLVELGSVKEATDWEKYQGRPHDFIGFDEICHFLEVQVRALMGWMRTDDPKQRCRVIFAGNPPTSSEGEWVIRFFAPWLDPTHPRPARPGELRWYVVDEKGADVEVDGPAPVMVGKRVVRPKSRTFIPSSVDDNLFYATTGYRDTLMALPEPLRSQMAEGNFQAGRSDHVWQVIPTEWVKAAQARWQDLREKPPMSALGFDVARGGIDKSCAARRHDWWFDKLVQLPGVITNDGPKAAGFVVPLLRDGAPIAVDAIGVGGSALDFLRLMNLNVVAVVNSEGTSAADRSGKLRFKNLRALCAWRLREALDPTATSPLALPLDPELLGDLCALRYKVVRLGDMAAIQIRDKDEIREELGRSPDRGDAVMMTFAPELELAHAGITKQAAAFRNRRRINDWRAR